MLRPCPAGLMPGRTCVSGRLNALPDTHATRAFRWLPGITVQAEELSVKSALITVVSEGSLAGAEPVVCGTRV
jgi:hypothetical protein